MNVTSLSELRKRIRNTRDETKSQVAQQLDHWVHWRGFQSLIEDVRKSVPSSPISEEIQRAPQLLTHFIESLEEMSTGLRNNPNVIESLLNANLAGLSGDLRSWQEGGYSVDRSINHTGRLKAWNKLFNEGLVQKDGSRVTYEDVIAERDANWNYAKGVPYWYLWNYGNISGESGYPSYGGLHFLERALFQRQVYEKAASIYFQEYISTFFETGRREVPEVLRDGKWRSAYK